MQQRQSLPNKVRNDINEAIYRNDFDTLQNLLKGLTPEQINEPENSLDQKTIIESAVIELKVDAVKLLVEHGANINAVNDYTGRTPLLELVTQPVDLDRSSDDFLKMLRTLHVLKADFNAVEQISPKRNAMMLAIVFGRFAFCPRLTQYGCNPNFEDVQGENVMQYAVNKFGLDTEEVNVLSMLGAKFPQGMESCRKMIGKKSALDLIMDAMEREGSGAVESSLNRADKTQGMSSFYLMLQNPAHYSRAKKLLRNYDCDLEIESVDGTAIHIALSQEIIDAELIQQLIDKGCNLQALNPEDKTPLQMVEERGLVQIREMIQKSIGVGVREADRQSESSIVPTNLFAKLQINDCAMNAKNDRAMIAKIDGAYKAIMAGNASMYKVMITKIDRENFPLIIEKCQQAIAKGTKPKNQNFYNEIIESLGVACQRQGLRL